MDENGAVVVMELAEQGEGFKEFGRLWQPAAAVIGQHKTAAGKVLFKGERRWCFLLGTKAENGANPGLLETQHVALRSRSRANR